MDYTSELNLERVQVAFQEAFKSPMRVGDGTLWLPNGSGGVAVRQLLERASRSVLAAGSDENVADDGWDDVALEDLGGKVRRLWTCGCAGGWGDPWSLFAARIGDRAYLVFTLPDEGEWAGSGGVMLGWSPASSRRVEDAALVHAYRQFGEALRFPFTASARERADEIESMVNRPRFRRVARVAAQAT